ncbi:MAG: gliding motility protein GldL [Bacteroidetes bacterium]|nr:gliding motility protein GldL [Bacteroidota bacterium]
MTFSEFAETKKFKTIMNYIYSLGAAVVIAGALFKIQHWKGADLMLNVGMGTEVFVFTVFAIDPTQVHMELDWSLVYPELKLGADPDKAKDENLSVTEELDNMLEEAKIGPELIESLGSGLKSLSDNTAKLSNLSDASVASNEFTNNMKTASQKIGTLSDAYDKASTSISGSISDLEKASSKTAQALDVITNSTQQQAGTYSEQLKSVSKNLTSLNSAYELQLQNSQENIKAAAKANEGIQKLVSSLEASMQAAQRDAVSYNEHLKKSSGNIQNLNSAYELQLQTMSSANKSYQGFEKAMASLGSTVEDATRFKQQIASLTDNLAALNTIYGNMLTAMSIGRK